MNGRNLALLALTIALLAVIVGIVVLLTQRGAQTSPPLPTLAALDSAPAAAAAATTAPPPTSAPATLTESATVTPSFTAPPATTAAPTASPTALPTETPVVELLAVEETAPVDPPTAPPPTSAPPTATFEDAASPPTIPPPPAPPVLATIVYAPGAPLNELVDIGSGMMLVIAGTRPGDDLIRDLGGSAGPAPAGYTWVVVELMLLCSGEDNCAPSGPTFVVAGSSFRPYPMSTDVQLEPLFGPAAYALGQVWGYLPFLVAENESGLTLVMDHNGQRYSFSLGI